MRTDALRVKSFAVRGLFGKYDHEISLSQADRITIIHGPNGVGKTVLLSLLHSVMSGSLDRIRHVVFDYLEVSFDDGSRLNVERKPIEATSSDPRERVIHVISYESPDAEPRSAEIGAMATAVRIVARRVARRLGFLSEVGSGRWLDSRTGDIFSSQQLVDRYGEEAKHIRSPEPADGLPQWYSELRKRMDVHFIETGRLIALVRAGRRGAAPGGRIPMVEACAHELQDLVSEALQEYAKTSQSLDQTYPQRLLREGRRGADLARLQQDMQTMAALRAEQVQVGLAEPNLAYPLDLIDLEGQDETKLSAIGLFVEDGLARLRVLEGLAGRMALFLGGVNGKLRNKKIRFERPDGLVVIAEDGRSIELSSLSSGEQHELILWFDLLFRVRAGALVLIDEPELSLHVVWQKQLLPDLLNIVRLRGFDVVLATHSPFIVGERADLMVAIGNA